MDVSDITTSAAVINQAPHVSLMFHAKALLYCSSCKANVLDAFTPAVHCALCTVDEDAMTLDEMRMKLLL